MLPENREVDHQFSEPYQIQICTNCSNNRHGIIFHLAHLHSPPLETRTIDAGIDLHQHSSGNHYTKLDKPPLQHRQPPCNSNERATITTHL
ncbi:hypothetical protein DEO72_LG7g1299 [Vigna unguiculata]|uniref:Uncharacterized protein n=1 Tax=Vigna unguiculata TaxID=3917 RepID=A0A4D6MEZ9_VIGUN|nr:hypothetical protein DEO72_LG7g1299 [Vigna unguiculata]